MRTQMRITKINEDIEWLRNESVGSIQNQIPMIDRKEIIILGQK